MVMSDTPAQLRDFVLFCVQRRTAEWPGIYDEMTRVAGRRLFQGLGSTELKELGLSFSLSSVETTMQLVKDVTPQHQA